MSSLDDKMKELDSKLTAILQEKLFQIKSELLAVVEQELISHYKKNPFECFTEEQLEFTPTDSNSKLTTLSQDELNTLILSHAKQQRIGLGNETVTDWLAGRVSQSSSIDPITSDLLFNMVETVIEEKTITNISEEMTEKAVEFLIKYTSK